MIRSILCFAAALACATAAESAQAGTVTFHIDATYHDGSAYNGVAPAFPTSGPVVGDIIVDTTPEVSSGGSSTFAASGELKIGTGAYEYTMPIGGSNAIVGVLSNEEIFLLYQNGGANNSVFWTLSASGLDTSKLYVPPASTPFSGSFGLDVNVPAMIDDIGQGATITGTITAVPEPATWMLLMLGVGLVGWSVRRRDASIATAQVTYT